MAADHFPGLYRGVCTDNLDPEGRQRIRLVCPQVLGDGASDWAWPCLPPGWHKGLLKPHATLAGHSTHTYSDTSDAGTAILSTSVHDHNHDPLTNNVLPAGANPGGHVLHQQTPNVGEGVWVMFEAGDSDFPIWMGIF